MQAEIYVDVIFAVNFFMDLFILYITGKIAKRKVKFWRYCLSAIVAAAIYCLFMFEPSLHKIFNVLSAVLLISGVVYITFAPMSLKEFVFLIFLAHISAFIAGGCAMAVFHLALEGRLDGYSISNNLPVKALLSASCISYAALKLIQGRLQKNQIEKFYKVKIFLGGIQVELRALADTGNSLTDPITKVPVIIAEFSKVKECLPNYVKHLFEENMQDSLEAVVSHTAGTPFAGRIRMVPFQSVGKNGMLIGFRPDKIEIHTDKEVIVKNAVVGIYNVKLSSENEYNALLNAVLIQ